MLFQVIPEKFFSILSSGNKRLYWECIYKLFTILSNQLSFSVKRDEIIDELVYYFDSEMSIEISGYNGRIYRHFGRGENTVMKKLKKIKENVCYDNDR